MLHRSLDGDIAVYASWRYESSLKSVESQHEDGATRQNHCGITIVRVKDVCKNVSTFWTLSCFTAFVLFNIKQRQNSRVAV